MPVIQDNLSKLPALCYGVHLTTGETVIIKRGVDGFFPTDWGVQGQDAVNRFNERLGVNRAQAEAMYVGSAFGWDVPGADPDRYDPLTGLSAGERDKRDFPRVLREKGFAKRGACAPGSVVLRDLGPDRPHRYVTHWRNEEKADNIFHTQGHYFQDLLEAETDFAARVRKEAD